MHDRRKTHDANQGIKLHTTQEEMLSASQEEWLDAPQRERYDTTQEQCLLYTLRKKFDTLQMCDEQSNEKS